jgi:hypothetical protein
MEGKMNLEPNWNDIDKCPIWKVLGVTECDNCDTRLQCWGKNSDLLEPQTLEEKAQWEKTLKELFHVK